MMISAVAALAIGGTVAYFSDTEVSNDNVISAGTIDIAVDGENPWDSTNQYGIIGLEPSDERDINVVLSNVGTNDVVIWKKVSATDAGNLISEPECEIGGGTWTEGVDTCTGAYVATDNISSQFVYSMNVGGSTHINQAWNVRVSDVNDLWIPIGRLNAGSTLAVDQNYYFDENAGNAYQGDSMTLDITFYAEQLDAPGPAHSTRGVVLENKNTTTWAPIVGDGTWGILTLDALGNYTAKAWGLNAGTYQLDYFVDPATDNFFGATNTVGAGGSVSYTGTRVGLTTATNAKYWLRDLSWNNANTLWEANLVN